MDYLRFIFPMRRCEKEKKEQEYKVEKTTRK